ncbi:MAG: allantoinase AllB, partial [Ornithinimicrobium sp.]
SRVPSAGFGWRGRLPLAAAPAPDLAVLAPKDTFTVDVDRLHHKNPITPYSGQQLHGVVRRTLLRGRPVGDSPSGELLRRGDA